MYNFWTILLSFAHPLLVYLARNYNRNLRQMTAPRSCMKIISPCTCNYRHPRMFNWSWEPISSLLFKIGLQSRLPCVPKINFLLFSKNSLTYYFSHSLSTSPTTVIYQSSPILILIIVFPSAPSPFPSPNWSFSCQNS